MSSTRKTGFAAMTLMTIGLTAALILRYVRQQRAFYTLPAASPQLNYNPGFYSARRLDNTLLQVHNDHLIRQEAVLGEVRECTESLRSRLPDVLSNLVNEYLDDGKDPKCSFCVLK